MSTRSVLWFRKGLRVHDNPALQRACEAGPSREHFEGIGLLLRHGLPLESSCLINYEIIVN